MDLSSQITISVPFVSVIISVVAVVCVFFGLSYYIVRLNRKVNILTPKFGFGGKNLSTVAMIAFLAGVVPLVAMLASNSTEIRRQAADSKLVVLNTQVLEKVEEEIVVGFSVVPMESGIAWAGAKYSAIWEVTGPTSFTFLEQDLDSQNPSYFTRILAPGNYEVKIKVTGDNFEVEKIEQIKF